MSKKSTMSVNIDTKTQKKATEIAYELGFELNSLINAFLKDLVRRKEVRFAILDEYDESEPSQYLLDSLKESEEDIKAGRFTSVTTEKELQAFFDEIMSEIPNKSSIDHLPKDDQRD